jgi:selenocysteine-specific elongation factor
MRVIGTAGHVDHGKSTLVRRLTQIDPDRLAEEKAREMTIDLGFAWLELGNGETVGIVDVPGHRDFIENMLAGIGGIDAVLLVIAADEGIMPQTREHLAILDLLGITNGLIVLTKIDLVNDNEWLDLVERDILDAVSDTGLSDAEIIRVSAHSGEGVPKLLSALSSLLNHAPHRIDSNKPCLPIDRVFTIAGFGTVVTGTLLGGTLRTGEMIEIQPGDLRGRIRGLQSYEKQVEIAYPGSRTAVNISGVEKRDVARGQILAYPGQIHPTQLVDVSYRQLSDTSRPLKHNAEVKFFSGAAETVARVRLLDREQVLHGEHGWLQLKLENPVPLNRNDRFILRFPSPAETIGGGVIVNPHPMKRWKRFQKHVITQLETSLNGSPGELIVQAAEGIEPVTRRNLQIKAGFSDKDMESAISEALSTGRLVEFSNSGYMAMTNFQALQNNLHEFVENFHRKFPLQVGMSREELRKRLGIKQSTLTQILDRQDKVIIDRNLARLDDHEVRFSSKQIVTINNFMGAMNESPYSPPSYSEAVAIVGEDVLRALIELGDIVRLETEIIFSRKAYDEMVNGLLAMIDEYGNVDARGVRDQFNTSRKYAIALLEHLDSIGVTQRTGDVRVRGT